MDLGSTGGCTNLFLVCKAPFGEAYFHNIMDINLSPGHSGRFWEARFYNIMDLSDTGGCKNLFLVCPGPIWGGILLQYHDLAESEEYVNLPPECPGRFWEA